MLTNRIKLDLKPGDFVSPILDSLSDMAVKLLGLRLVIIYPTKDGMAQALVGSSHYLSEFCRLVQGSPDGAEHCRICHLLMAQKTPHKSSMVKRCHSGVSTLVQHLPGARDCDLAILTSCALVNENAVSAGKIIQRRGKKLGIDSIKLKKAQENLCKLDPEKMELALMIMNMAAQALTLILDKLTLERDLEQEKKRHTPDEVIATAINAELNQAISTLSERRPRSAEVSRSPSAALIDVISDLMARKPDLPFRLTAIAAACRITPNHFSHLFHEHHKKCFSGYLTEQRLNRAKILLKNPTLNVAQVAAESGFRDAGYFSRRFRQVNGVSPGEWRKKLSRSNGKI
ncbi:MAG: helix-turn-helix domain-containing protein [bacterium]